MRRKKKINFIVFEEIQLLVAKRVKNSRRKNERSKTTMLSWRFEECSRTFGSQGTNDQQMLCTTFSVQGITKINNNNGVISNHSGLQINHMHCTNYFGTVFSPFVPTQKQLLKSRRSTRKRLMHFSTHFSTLLLVLKRIIAASIMVHCHKVVAKFIANKSYWQFQRQLHL